MSERHANLAGVGSEPLSDVVVRAMTGNPADPDAADVLRLYLELPTIVPWGATQRLKIRSSFEAGFTDAEVAAAGPRWLAAVGYLCWFDQVGSAIRRLDQPPTVTNRPFEKALEWFSDLSDRDRAAMYALRCALAHDYSLVNVPRDRRNPRWPMYQHAFVLHLDRELAELVELPIVGWDGDPQHAHRVVDGAVVEDWQTHVDLTRLGDLARAVRQEILDLYGAGGAIVLALSPAEVRRRYFFVHPPGLDE